MPRLSWIGLALLVMIAALVRELLLGPSGALRVVFLDVGQGDSALIVTPSGRQILIDGGPDRSALQELKEHMPLLDRSLDMLVLTHGDLDHIAAFPDLLASYRVGAVMLTGIPGDNAAYPAFTEEVARQGIPVLRPDPGIDLDLGDGVLLDSVWPPPSLTHDAVGESPNDGSVVLRALFRGHAILFTGDIEEAAERAILASGVDIDADVLKVPHHGSKTSSSTGFLLAVSPDTAVISVGKKNRYGHPFPAVVERYRRLGIAVQTTMSGAVEMTFD